MRVRVPGKVMLSGEYSVLHGGTAVLAPVPRFLELRESYRSPAVALPPVLTEALELPIPEIEKCERELPPLAVEADFSEFTAPDAHDQTVKLGIGGSAAEAVAAITLRLQRCNVDWPQLPQRLFELADTVHRHVQGGAGSGADVAAVAWGKPIRFRRVDGKPVVDVINPAPPEFSPRLALLWTGIPADTRSCLQTFNRWINTDSNSLEELKQLAKLSHRLATAWFTTPLDNFFVQLDAFTVAMERIAVKAGIPWKLPIHDELGRWARDHGGRAKPTGAGAGDMILLVGDLPLHERPEFILPLNPVSFS